MEPYGEVDIIWRSLNKCGRFQLFQWAVVLLDTMPACFTILSAVLTGNRLSLPIPIRSFWTVFEQFYSSDLRENQNFVPI